MAEGALSADGRIHMVTTDGTPILVPKERIQEAYASGAALESPEAVEQRAIARERGTLGQQAITAVEGGARGLTLGASDVAAAAVLGEGYGQAALERQQVNPITAIGSELVGGLVGAKGTGILKYSPAAVAAKAGSGAARLAEGGAALAGYRGTTAAGRLAAKALSVGAAGATEGALWGAGSAASRAALEGQQITAEKLLAGAGEGAELGGLFGAGLGAGGHFLGAAARKAASVAGLEGGLGGIGARLRDRATLRATGFRRADVRKLGATTERVERRVAELADDVREYKFRGNTEASAELKGAKLWERAGKPEELAADLTIARREVGAELGSIRKKIDDALSSQVGPADSVNAVGLKNAQYLRNGMREESAAFARRAYEGADPALANEIATTRVEPVRVELFPDEAGGFRVSLGDGRHRMLAAEEAGATQIRANIQQWTPDGDTIDLGEHVVSLTPSAPQRGPDVGTLLQQIQDEVLAPLRGSLSPDVQAKARRVEASIATLAERHAASNAAPWEAGFGATKPVSFAELDQFRRDLRSVFQPKRPAGGGIPAPVPEHAAELEAVERMVSQTIDDSAVSTLRKMGQDPTEYLELKRQFGAMRDLESVATRAASDEAARGLTSPWERILGFGGAIGAMASGNIGALAAGIGGAAASRILQNYGDRALVKMLDTVSSIDSTVNATARALAGKEAPKTRAYAAVPVVVSKAVEQYERARDAVREFDEDPREMMGQLARLTDRYSVEYPGISGAVQAQAIRQVNAVRAALPQPYSRAATSLTPAAEESLVGIQDITDSLRKIRGITSPAAVIQDLREGNLDLTAIKALEENSPAMFAELRTAAMREVATREESMPMRERLFLGLAFGFVSDYSLRPGVISAIQASQAPPPEIAAESPTPSNAQPPGSMSDRLEGM